MSTEPFLALDRAIADGMLHLHRVAKPSICDVIDVQLDNNLLDSPQFEFVDRPPSESWAEAAIGRIKPNPAKPRPLESILPSIIVRRGFDRFVCYCARRRVEIDAAHAGAGDLDNMRRRVKFVGLHQLLR